MLKVYDCSNSLERPPHRGGGGPVENGTVSLLKKYAHQYDVTFVDKPTEADVIFTNDVFPQAVLALKIPRVKRMDGIFWQLDLMQRNAPYVQACLQANNVIFISIYSRIAYDGLFPRAKHSPVIRSCVDPEIFNPTSRRKRRFPPEPQVVVACATSWDRPEKRFSTVALLAVRLPQVRFMFVGGTPEPRTYLREAKNVYFCGALDHPVFANVLNTADTFINMSYRDPGPKVVGEAAATGLPVFYADSGGTSEMVEAGLSVRDPRDGVFEPGVPRLDLESVVSGWQEFCRLYSHFASGALHVDPVTDSKRCLEGYFRVLREEASAA